MLFKLEQETPTKILKGGELRIEFPFRIRTRKKTYVCNFIFNLKNKELVYFNNLQEEIRLISLRNRIGAYKSSRSTMEEDSKIKREYNNLKEYFKNVEIISFLSKNVTLNLLNATDGINNIVLSKEVNYETHFLHTLTFDLDDKITIHRNYNEIKIIEDLSIMAMEEVKKESREKTFISF